MILYLTPIQKLHKVVFIIIMTLLLKNVNTNSNNSDNYKEERDHYLSGLFQFNSSLPLIKKKKDYLHILKPKTGIKIKPRFYERPK